MVNEPHWNCPPDLYLYLAASLTIWSKAGKMKSANCISAIAVCPLTANPMPNPMIPCSDRGVLKTLSMPKRSYSPEVHLNTPPYFTSSPKTFVLNQLRLTFSQSGGQCRWRSLQLGRGSNEPASISMGYPWHSQKFERIEPLMHCTWDTLTFLARSF